MPEAKKEVGSEKEEEQKVKRSNWIY